MRRQILAVAVLALVLAGCRGEPPAVARLSVEPRLVHLGFPDVRSIHVSWQPIAALGDGAPPFVFVHLLDRHDRVLRTFDHPFPGAWQEGVPVSYDLKLFQSALATPLAPGHYRLTAGLYGAKGMRWPLAAGPKVGRLEYQVAEVEVPGGSPGPHVAYRGVWLPSEKGSDRQFLARRWLEGEGTIELRDLPGAGSVWLVLTIPEAQAGNERMVFDDGANAPAVLIDGSCGGAEAGLSGSGRHEIPVAADGSAHGGVCEIHLKPNFSMVSPGGRPERSVALDALAWMPGPADGSAARPSP
jgi:hypothetical protein